MKIPASALLLCSAFVLAACGERDVEPAPDASEPAVGASGEAATPAETGEEMTIDASQDDAAATPADAAVPEYGSLAWAVAGPWRNDADRARDGWRNPVETLEFFGVDPASVVVEIWPGGGWYADILAPWIAANGGTYVAATFPADSPSEARRNTRARTAEHLASDPVFGDAQLAGFSDTSGPLMPDGSADTILTFRNVHNWMMAGFAEKAFDDFYAALRPGGILGVVEHRSPSNREQDPRAASGYVQEAYVIRLAEEAGFEFVASSDINANPADTADHPFGVWTLPPVGRTAPAGQDPDPDFDRAPYDAIGESDRMTLLFRRPADAQ